MEITVTNPTRSRKWGFEYSTQPERNSTRIVPPTKPYYTGTLRQVRASIDNDRTFASVKSGGTYYSARWFYNGKAVIAVNGNEYPGMFGAWLNELDFEQMRGRTIDSVILTLAD